MSERKGSETTTYEGWSNYETFAVNHYLENDSKIYEEVLEALRQPAFFASEQVKSVRAIIEKHIDNFLGLWTNLYREDLDCVDWDEIIEHWNNVRGDLIKF